ncbi:hypothetical protein D3C87_1756550 [compost metagenome]
MLIAVPGLKEAAILIEDFFAGITGQPLECRVYVNQDVVLLAFLFGNHDAVVGSVDHHLQQLCVDHRRVLSRLIEQHSKKEL